MKFLTSILLFSFLSFQFLPSIIILIENEKESKVSWLLLEEDNEDSKETKEVKMEFLFVSLTNELVILTKKERTNNSIYLLKDYLAHLLLHYTPPKLV
ncbi:hypothetical protein [Flavobacterium oreochromis]|uniref:Uncharacterized protein n=2 Tax=Flavobacterium TaxID=237 RepID=A0A246GD20_9FLAO|nr:hypothetical protein [Flavobacterium oreochromis]OWP79214.1 hypothetical protein BWK62_03625 [Flavobacterium oreochromis]